MNKSKLFSLVFAVLVTFCFISKSNAQKTPVLYFCERYTSSGEVNISDRFYTGYLTVMVKSDSEIGLTDCAIQYDKYNPSTKIFSYYRKFTFTVKSNMKYIYFERSSENDMSFDEPGIYRVFLLDGRGQTVTSSLIEIL